MYLRKKLKLLLLLLLTSSLLWAQTKPIVKIELQAGIGLRSGDASFFLPAVYVPVYQHIELGASYYSMKISYGGHFLNGSTDENVIGTVIYKFPSFYIKFNVFNDLKHVNPFIGYIFSRVKGSHQEVVYGSGSNLPNDGYHIHTRMTPAEQAQLEAALGKTESAHGFQMGVDIKLFRNLSFFLKGTLFAFSGGKAFPYQYQSNTYSYNYQPYGMVGFIIKFYGASSNKKLIK